MHRTPVAAHQGLLRGVGLVGRPAMRLEDHTPVRLDLTQRKKNLSSSTPRPSPCPEICAGRIR